MIKQED
jgi:hypothetical protein